MGIQNRPREIGAAEADEALEAMSQRGMRLSAADLMVDRKLLSWQLQMAEAGENLPKDHGFQATASTARDAAVRLISGAPLRGMIFPREGSEITDDQRGLLLRSDAILDRASSEHPNLAKQLQELKLSDSAMSIVDAAHSKVAREKGLDPAVIRGSRAEGEDHGKSQLRDNPAGKGIGVA